MVYKAVVDSSLKEQNYLNKKNNSKYSLKIFTQKF